MSDFAHLGQTSSEALANAAEAAEQLTRASAPHPKPDLAAFLRARLDEDEQAARAAEGAEWSVESRRKTREIDASKGPGTARSGVWVVTGEGSSYGIADAADTAHAQHIARHDPSRVLAEVDAKRRAIAVHTSWEFLARSKPEDPVARITTLATAQILWALALPYANHPDYRTEWAITDD